LEFLRSRASDRKLRLFVADVARVLKSVFGNEQEVVAEMMEQVAEGQMTEENFERWLLRGMPSLWEHRAPGGNLPTSWESARSAAWDRFKLAPLETGEVITP